MGASTGQALVWNGTSWAPSTVASGWSLTGNSGTNPSTNFLGTTDYNRLVFKTNNIERATFLPTGYFGLGITNPSATLHNNGTTIFSVRSISNKLTGGDIDNHETSVDIGSNFAVNQITPGQTLTLPYPYPAVAGKMVKISNSGTAAFTMYNTVIAPSKFAEFMWTGSTWIPMTGGSSSVVNKKLVFSAEYAGAVIVPGSGTNHIGDMIGGNTGNNSPRYMNYYEWKGRSSSGIQTYQIILRITLPNDFTNWLNNAIVIDYLVNSGCNLQFSFYNLSNTLLTSQTLNSSGWNKTTIWASSLSSWITPGETVALIITLSSTNNNVVRIGDIILNYK